jgi:pyruvate dehydrogenase E1 component alpha subunit
MVEAVTYRSGGHSRADPGKYRPAAEVEAWAGHDPIPLYHGRLLKVGVAEEELTSIERQAALLVDEATEFAKAGALPGEDVLMTEVYADGSSRWRN